MYSKNILFIFSIIFFLLGVFVNNINSNLIYSFYVLLALVVLFLFYFLLTKKHYIVLLFSLITFILWILLSNYVIEKNNYKETIIKPYYNTKVKVNLKVKKVEKINSQDIEYLVKLKSLWDKEIESNILWLIKIWKNFKLEKNNTIVTSAKIQEIKDFNGFSYRNYLLSKNIFFKANIYDLKIHDKWDISYIEQNIIKLRKTFLNTIYEIYPKQEAIFLWWILLWARESLDNELKTYFNNSWLTHFIAVSWFNITIIIVFLSFLLKYFPIFLRVIIITLSIIFFTILVWDTAPVIRASIMWLIWYYIINSWRKVHSLTIILTTLAIMTIFSPLSLNFDVSLHLSFLAVLWIIYSQKFFEKFFSFLPNFLEIRTAFCLTMSALVFTLPIMIFNFWQLSILAPFANIAVAWTIPIAMLLGFLSIIVYFVYTSLGIWIWYFTWIFLKWDMLMVNFFWKQDWAIIKFDFSLFKYHFELLYFIVLLFILIYFRKRKEVA